MSDLLYGKILDACVDVQAREQIKKIDGRLSDIEGEIGDLPDVPTKTSELENDSGFITEEDLPEVPTKTSELENDSGFIIEHQHIKTINGQSIIGDGNVVIEAGTQPDWEQNDDTANDYIKNRPFYESGGDKEVVLSTEVTRCYDYETSAYFYYPDEIYKDIFVDYSKVKDGITFEKITMKLDNTFCEFLFDRIEDVSNMDRVYFKEKNNYMNSFVWLVGGDSQLTFEYKMPYDWGYVDMSDVRLYYSGGVVKQLDEKFIPENIARKSDIPTKVSQLENDSEYLTQHQPIKTINGQSIVGEGNLEIDIESKLDKNLGEENYGKLLYVNENGDITVLALGEGLEIEDGVLKLADKTIILGNSKLGESTLG